MVFFLEKTEFNTFKILSYLNRPFGPYNRLHFNCIIALHLRFFPFFKQNCHRVKFIFDPYSWNSCNIDLISNLYLPNISMCIEIRKYPRKLIHCQNPDGLKFLVCNRYTCMFTPNKRLDLAFGAKYAHRSPFQYGFVLCDYSNQTFLVKLTPITIVELYLLQTVWYTYFWNGWFKHET